MVLLLVGCAAMQAQTALKYGYLHYDSLLVKMSDYAAAQEQLATLRKQYQQETDYNEQGFKRQFAEFLQGQKNFPQNILLKRQRDLQEAMEKSIAFRQSAEELLKKAAVDLLQPVRQRLDAAIREVGMEHGYQFVLNLDANWRGCHALRQRKAPAINTLNYSTRCAISTAQQKKKDV